MKFLYILCAGLLFNLLACDDTQSKQVPDSTVTSAPLKPHDCGPDGSYIYEDVSVKHHNPGDDEYLLRVGGKGPWWPRLVNIRFLEEDDNSSIFSGSFLGFLHSQRELGENIKPLANWLECEHANGRVPLVTGLRFFAAKGSTVAVGWNIDVRHATEQGLERDYGGGNLDSPTCLDRSEYTLTRNGTEHPALTEITWESRGKPPERRCLLHVNDTPLPCPSEKPDRKNGQCFKGSRSN